MVGAIDGGVVVGSGLTINATDVAASRAVSGSAACL